MLGNSHNTKCTDQVPRKRHAENTRSRTSRPHECATEPNNSERKESTDKPDFWGRENPGRRLRLIDFRRCFSFRIFFGRSEKPEIELSGEESRKPAAPEKDINSACVFYVAQ